MSLILATAYYTCVCHTALIWLRCVLYVSCPLAVYCKLIYYYTHHIHIQTGDIRREAYRIRSHRLEIQAD